VLAALVYARRRGSVLLLCRSHYPYCGLWTAPGGKLLRAESPAECAMRELREEVGLTARSVRLRGLVTEVSPLPHYR